MQRGYPFVCSMVRFFFQLGVSGVSGNNTLHGWEAGIYIVTTPEKLVRMLVVEDSDADALLLKHALRDPMVRTEFEVCRVKSLKEASQALGESEFNVVLLDLSLPDSRGVETVRALRRFNRDVPIIVMSGLDDDVAAFESIQAEAQDYLVKGQATGRQLDQAVSHAIERHNIQQTFREALILSVDAIRIFAKDGEVVFRNQSALTNLTADDENRLFDRESEGTPGDSEFVLEDGTVVETRSARLVWDRKPALFLGLRDVTAKKKAAQQLRELQERALQSQRLESLGTLAGGVAHEFNNLLTGILGNSDLLAQGWIDMDEVAEIARDIRESAQRAARLTRHLLGFARKGSFRNERFDLHKKIEETRYLLGPILRREVVLAFDLLATETHIECDPDQFSQVLLNLALNGQDAMAQGGTLTFRTRQDSFNRLVLEICDEGSGIPDSIREKIFDPFFTTKPQHEGTGMGLAMVWGTANQNGWILDVETEVGKGTSFRITFPNENQLAARGSHGKILIVEEEACVRDTLRRFLRQLNFDVVEFEGSGALFQALAGGAETFDCLLADVLSTNMPPPEFLARVREQCPEAVVVFMSADTNTDLGVEADAFLFKPFDFKLVAHVLHQAFSNSGHQAMHHLSTRL